MDWKKIIRLLYPPVWIMVLLTLLCTLLLVFTFMYGYEQHPIAYAVYVLSFYTLTSIVMHCIKVIPKQYKTAKQSFYNNPLGKRLSDDIPFRTHLSLFCSLVANLLYVAVNILSGVVHKSAWFYVLAFYYAILAIMRFLLVRFVNRTGIGNDSLGEMKRSRLCGYILLTVNLFLSGAVLMILYRDKGFEYNGILIYVIAAYTFWLMGLAIKNLIKYRRLGSPVMSMAKIISMAAALVSMLSLETAMFSEFGAEMPKEDQRLMIALTGAGVSIIIITMSVYSIMKNSKEIKNITEAK